MAIFGQNRLFFSVEFRQRFIGQPGSQCSSSRVKRTGAALPLCAYGVVCQYPATSGVSALTMGLWLSARRPSSSRLWKLTKATSCARVTMPRRLQPAPVKVCSAPGVASTG